MITAGDGATGLAALMDERSRFLDRFAEHARQTSEATGGLLAQTSTYAFHSPGKLLRPLLLLEACRAVGGNPDQLFPAAAGTEYGHVASLIHDDIIDGDDERHGRRTLHLEYDLGAAILTGDLLIFETFLSYTRCHDHGVSAELVLQAIRVLSSTCIEVCRGQALESSVAGDLDTTEALYLDLIRLKTASVCRAATQIGALLSGATEPAITALSRFGEYLGMTFQIVDDLLSYEGRAATLGKPVRSDLRNRRVTLPVILALQGGDLATRARIRDLFASAPAADTRAHAELVALLAGAHALERTRALAYRYTTLAEAQLEALPYSAARERLRALATLFVSRDQ